MLAGIPVKAELVRELAERVDEPTAGYLLFALEAGRSVVALTNRGSGTHLARA
jgi:ribosomal protein L10